MGQSRATREVAQVLCTLSAGTAAASTAAAAVEMGSGEVDGGQGWRGAATVIPRVAAPRALLPVLESLPPRSADVIGLAVEVLKIGQAAADALVGVGDGGGGGIFAAKDGAGRSVSFGEVFVFVCASVCISSRRRRKGSGSAGLSEKERILF